MHHRFKSAIIAMAITIPALANPTMKITFNGTVDPVDLSAISKMAFSGTDLIVGSKTYGIKNISKIEFIDISTAIGTDSKTIRLGIQPAQLINHTLNLTTASSGPMSVTLFAMNGRKVAELYNGNVSAGIMAISMEKQSIAAGVYSLVIVQSNSAISQKIQIK